VRITLTPVIAILTAFVVAIVLVAQSGMLQTVIGKLATITSQKGCHISKAPLSPQDANYMYHYWRED